MNDSRAPLSVLVVDDSPDAAISTAELLILAGHTARIAVSGGEALAAIAAAAPDVVLLDIGMPGLDGWAVAARVRRLPLRQQPVIVAVTGHGADGDRRRSAVAGIDLHLVKPVNPSLLFDLLDRFRRARDVTTGPCRPRTL